MEQFERYWIFAVFCLVVGVFLIRLVFRERVTLQSSLLFLSLLLALLVFALVPGLTVNVARAMGFALPSNFFFTAGIGTLVLLHVHTLIMLSRTELRSITLTQELGLLREKVDRLSASVERTPVETERLPGSPPSGNER